MDNFGLDIFGEIEVDKDLKSGNIERDENIIKEINSIVSEDWEEGSYISASIQWLLDNDYKIDKSIVNHLPSEIIMKIKEEAFEDNLVRPSLNPNMSFTSNDLFIDLFIS